MDFKWKIVLHALALVVVLVIGFLAKKYLSASDDAAIQSIENTVVPELEKDLVQDLQTLV